MKYANLKISDKQTMCVNLNKIHLIEWREDQRAVTFHNMRGESRTYVFQSNEYFDIAKSEVCSV